MSRRFPFGREQPGAPRAAQTVEPAPRMTEPVAEGWRPPVRVLPFRAPPPQAPPVPEEPVRATLPELPPPSPGLGWMVLGIALAITGAAAWLFVRAIDRPAEPAIVVAPPASNASTAEAASTLSATTSAPSSAASSATTVPRRPPARRSKPAAAGEIRDPWGTP